jgi:5-oxoprolinase (ATP-hydrolysing)
MGTDQGGWRFWIDRGGTFTDVVACAPDGTLHTAKLLSDHPERYADAATAGIRQVLGLGFDAPIPPGCVADVRMGTTVATNALLERKGEATLLVITAGFGDLLAMGHLARPDLFDVAPRLPEPLHRAVLEVTGRVGADGAEIAPLDEAAVRDGLARHRAAGLTACAVALIHGWRWPAMELRIAELAHEAGFAQVTASHVASPAIGLVARGRTGVVDAYLSPVLGRYVAQVAGDLGETPLAFMRSDGTLAPAHAFHGRDAILSGPAGGVVGAARTAQAAGFDRVIAFDMGGTSTDIAICDGAPERRYAATIAGVDIGVPMLAIDTIAAGGGSIIAWDGARLTVGPASAGANPGPACYRRGGPLTVTDANVMTGRIGAAHFPAIFGPDGDQPLDQAVVERGFADLAQAIGDGRSPHDLAEGCTAIAVAAMAAAIKRRALARGADVRDFALQCFGGAGAQHACRIADELGMRTVLIHPLAGVLSAYGMGLAAPGTTRRAAIEAPLDDALVTHVAAEAERLGAEAQAEIGEATVTRTLRLRYEGTDTALGVAFDTVAAMRDAFTAVHRARFGYAEPGRALVVVELLVEASGRAEAPVAAELAPGAAGAPVGHTPFGPVHDRAALGAGATIAGPAMIREGLATTIVEPGWRATMRASGDCVLVREGPDRQDQADTGADTVRLELWSGRFMALAEQMGSVLVATATSVNMKERLDFSCALFDATGNLVANAPHVPVHLGAMGESVRTILAAHRDDLRPGDAFVLNNPFNGGTHLPDVTVISPVFGQGGLRGFVATRGHHADIGGTTPGSSPPHARTLAEEGVVIDDFLLVRDGVLREAELRAVLAEGPWPARNPDANLADLRAQIAANAAGAQEFAALEARHGADVVVAWMGHVLDGGEAAVRRVLRGLQDARLAVELDDGRPLVLALTVRGDTARFDFTGTGAAEAGNMNAPPAVTRAVVLYALRCLIGTAIPLNDGCLRPVELAIPPGSLLAPPPGSAVVAGNTEVSQQLVNLLFAALGLGAAAQGTMNNVLFGNDRHQYYETIGGGMGAGPGHAGAGPMQCHMTNTRITDPDVLEWRLPVRLDRFGVRRGSGGAGAWPGGDGAVRAVRALEPMVATLIASSRIQPPFGLAGGAAGAPGRQWVERADGRHEAIAGRAEVALEPGDVVVIETPGGGGYGASAPERADS